MTRNKSYSKRRACNLKSPNRKENEALSAFGKNADLKQISEILDKEQIMVFISAEIDSACLTQLF